MSSIYISRRLEKYQKVIRNQAYIPVNTYPWPYCDPEFAPWEEDDRPETYTLVTDPANFVIRRSTSYVAWKIAEATGVWPMKRSDDGTIFHAKNWQKFLQLNGYDKVVEEPIQGRHYVGIIPDEGEFGQVVWLEGMALRLRSYMKPRCKISTYRNFEYAVEYDYDCTKAIWIEIC